MLGKAKAKQGKKIMIVSSLSFYIALKAENDTMYFQAMQLIQKWLRFDPFMSLAKKGHRSCIYY